MAAEQQMSDGNPPVAAANLTIKPNILPASKPTYLNPPAYHASFNNNNFAMSNTHQTSSGTSLPFTPNPKFSHHANSYYQNPRIVVAPSFASSYDPKRGMGATHSPFCTFSTVNMVAASNTPGQTDTSTKLNAGSFGSFKRKPGFSHNMAMEHASKRLKLADSNSIAVQVDIANSNPPSIQDTDSNPPKPLTFGQLEKETSVVKRNVGGRPKSAQPKVKNHVGPTRLRKNKPVAAEVHMDIWELILPYCPLRFLFTARNINKQFRERLKYESLWKKCRIQNHGENMPAPLPGMKEWDYANLMEGLGCMGCGNKRTRKTYRAFQKRWCAKCLEKNTVLESASNSIRSKHPKILECIPHGLFDSWGHYESAGNYTHSGWHRIGHGQQRGFETASITQQLHEVEEFLASGEDGKERTEEEIEAWYAPRLAANLHFVKEVQALEDWVEKSNREKLRDAGQQKTEREKYYKGRALAMDPPLQAAALELIQAYKRAIAFPRVPSERSWQVLYPKLVEGRVVAEKLVQEEQDRLERVELNQKLSMEYTDIMIRRSTEDTVEQKLVLKLADEVLSNLDQEIPVGLIDDGDYVLLVLCAIREKYYRLDEPARPLAYGKDGTYRLPLDDAKMVYEKKISPSIEEWKDPARSKAARLFKCPGCTRTDINLRYTFGQLFCHLTEKHASQIGDFSILRGDLLQLPVGVRFPWCRLEWPIKLPILAEHHTSTGRWSPDDASDYVLAPPKPPPVLIFQSAFEQREASATDGPGREKFVDNIIYAGSLLRHTGLVAKYQTQITLKFAVQKYAMVSDEPPSMEEIPLLDLARIRTGNYPLFDHFRCKACCDTPEPARNNKFVNKCQPFGELASHFKLAHFHLSWVSDMLVLPSETELWMALTEPGMESALEAFDKLFPLKEEHLLDPMLRGHFKAPVAKMSSQPSADGEILLFPDENAVPPAED